MAVSGDKKEARQSFSAPQTSLLQAEIRVFLEFV